MKTGRQCLALSVMLVLALSSSASGVAAPTAGARASDSLQWNGVFTGKWQGVPCSAGTPKEHQCGAVDTEASVAGLGETAEHWSFDLLNTPGCSHLTFSDAHLTVGTIGQIDLALVDPSPTTADGCDTTNPTQFLYTVTGGSGRFAGATGSGRMTPVLVGDAGGSARNTYSGTLAVPSITFDVVAPTISGFRPKVVRIPKTMRSVRVTYHVAAVDKVDGNVPVKCRPAPGSRFRVGTTQITCAASDSSGNSANASFKLKVIRKR